MVAFVPGVAAHDDEEDRCHADEPAVEAYCNSTGEIFGSIPDISGCEDGTGVTVGDGEVCVSPPQNPCGRDLVGCLTDLLDEWICFDYIEPRCE
jgi:hypothetical protein